VKEFFPFATVSRPALGSPSLLSDGVLTPKLKQPERRLNTPLHLVPK